MLLSRLEELLEEFCPDGVKYKELGEFATIARGGNFQKKDFTENGVPCIHYGQIYKHFGIYADQIITYINEDTAKKSKYAKQNDIVMAVTSENVEDVCKCVAWLGCEDIAISGHTAIIRHKQNPKYLSYYFHSSMFFNQKKKLAHGTKVIEVTPAKLLDIIIPLPSIEVQNEIVRILDNIRVLTDELTEELTAELIKRKKQYEYYREAILDFSNRNDVPIYKIGELFDFKNGINKGKEFFGKGIPIVNFTDVYNNNSLTKEMLKGKVDATEDEMSRYGVKKGDVFFTRTSETKEEIGMTSVLVEDIEKCVFSGFILRARPKTSLLLPEYCSYCFATYTMRKEIIRYSTYTTRALTNGRVLSGLDLAVPSIDDQKKIVAILNNFNDLCNDISEVLPAEIEARRKQFQYYRDKLLTFKELGA